MWVKLSTEAKEKLIFEDSFVAWDDLKSKISGFNDTEILEILKGSEFTSINHSIIKTRANAQMTKEEYHKLAQISPSHSGELSQLRSEISQIRRENTWLFNCFFSVIGTAAFVYFLAAFYFDKFESRIVCALLAGLALFFIEIVLYIIRY